MITFVMIHDKARVDAIHARMNEQLLVIDSLKSKIAKGNLDALDVARNQTEDIESFSSLTWIAPAGPQRRRLFGFREPSECFRHGCFT